MPERGALTPAQRELVSISAAAAAGDTRRIAEQTDEAIHANVDAGAIYEALLQSYLFLGFPRAIEAFFAASPVLERAGFQPPDRPAGAEDPGAWRTAGEALCRRVYGKNYEKLVATMERLSPDLAVRMILEGYGATLARPGLDPVTREYCVVALLATTRMERQLRSHAIGAVNVGGTRAGVRETIERCTPFVGAQAVREALRGVGMEASNARG